MTNYRDTCDSRFHHESSIEGNVLHYFGCLKFAERQPYFESLGEKDKLKLRILEEEARIRKLREAFEADGSRTPNGKLLERFRITRNHWRRPTAVQSRSEAPPQAPNPAAQASQQCPENKHIDLDDLNANLIYFKDAHPYDHPSFPDENFPNQKIPLRQLLEEDKKSNPLMWECEDNMIRYFHLPANNMDWVEDAMARYYNESRPDLDGPYRKPPRGDHESKARMLLRPQFWRGLQHGNRSDLPTHTRHMRPRCYPISTDHFSTKVKPKNLALFMPYLHWETDRRRARGADVVKKKSNAKWAALVDVVEAEKNRMIESQILRATSDGFPETIETRVDNQNPRSALHKITDRTIQGQTLLGRLLMSAAALSEAMDAYTDEQLIHKYLTAAPPLHPRRTLDQSYYWTLKDTRKRDRDQVVYRSTAPDPKLMHRKCFDKNCAQCKEDVTKVPRVVMVDQLWMWILDEKTIITAFPKRWGRNKPDPSAVQKCIRTRLRSARDDEVRSVFDLAIIIIDQCSGVFFDRTQSVDLQPQVLDNFANAIGKVTHRQTIAFDQFWEYTRLTSKRYASRDEPETSAVRKMQKTLLDINPEGDLLREIKDIIEELFIMTSIKLQEESVVRSFVKHVRHILQPGATASGGISIRNQSNTSLPDLQNSPTSPRAKRGSLAAENPHKSSVSNPTVVIPDSEDFSWTMTCAQDLLASISDQLLELKYLKDAAENTSLALKDLLDLKQQQAGVVEAREAVKLGEETLRQGRSIMMFTIVTIIFLPLSFFTGVFGMNATELTGSTGDYRFRNIFIFMIPISAVVITCSLFLAFSKLVRALLSFAFNVAWAWVITRTSAYVRWHETHTNSKSLKEEEKRIVNEMKVKALRDEVDRKMREAAVLADQIAEKEKQQAVLRTRKHARVRQHPNGDIELGG